MEIAKAGKCAGPRILAMTAFFVAWTIAAFCRAQAPESQAAGVGRNYEITSALGRKFYSLPDEKGAVAAAEKEAATRPNDAALLLKLAQAQATVWQYREAVATCTKALESAPKSADLYLERGHREIALREFDRARVDLNRAVALDSGKVDAYYHLGLAHYFLGEFGQAAAAFRRAVELAPNTEARINSTNWLYASLRRANRSKEAAQALTTITPNMTASGHSQFYLHLIRFFQGGMKESELIPAEPARDGSDLDAELQFDTVGYGVGNWYLYNGDPVTARKYFENVVQGRVWVTWGFVGAEREMARTHR